MVNSAQACYSISVTAAECFSLQNRWQFHFLAHAVGNHEEHGEDTKVAEG